MTYKRRLVLFILLDSVIVSTAIFIAAWVVYPQLEVLELEGIGIIAIALLLFHHMFAAIYKLYNKVWAYASVGELITIFKVVTLSIIAAGLAQLLFNDFKIYSRALLVTWLIYMILIGGSRFIWRMISEGNITSDSKKKRTLIVGAGSAGSMIARQLQKGKQSQDLLPVAFVDDDMTRQNMEIYNVPVRGRISDIADVTVKHHIDHIVIAIPSLGQDQLNKIIQYCHQTNAQVQMIPKLEDLMTGKVSVSQLKQVDVEDLLGREPVELDMDTISESVTDNTVMVTGAGGSIGSELCRQLMRFTPKKIVLLDHSEYNIYTIDMELKDSFGQAETEIVPVIGDVQDKARIHDVIVEHTPAIIYHAAAHKHVPLMENNPQEAVKNNIMGTRIVADAADAGGVGAFVLVSSDKAVNPTNVMGATKRIAEMTIQDMNKHSQTTYVAVRFGNVLGSSGSVIPLFKKQIEQGGPVTVTDPGMTRYFMTVPEAARLVIQAGTLARGGEIFVLDVGEPVKIIDLAKNLIKLSGYTENEIPIHICGKRPGEKMYEELLSEKEVHPDPVHEKIYVGRTVSADINVINQMLADMHAISNDTLKDTLLDIVYMEQQQLDSVPGE